MRKNWINKLQQFEFFRRELWCQGRIMCLIFVKYTFILSDFFRKIYFRVALSQDSTSLLYNISTVSTIYFIYLSTTLLYTYDIYYSTIYLLYILLYNVSIYCIYYILYLLYILLYYISTIYLLYIYFSTIYLLYILLYYI